MVQEARLDLRLWATLSLGLVLLASPALAQNDPPLTTLLLPHHLSTPTPLSRTAPLSGQDRLFGDDPLANVGALTGEGSLSNPRPRRQTATGSGASGQDRVTCDRSAVARRRQAQSSVAFGGSGPGEYARFLPHGGQADGNAPASPDSPRTSSTPSAPGQSTSIPDATPQASAGLPGDRPLWSESRPRAHRRSPATERQTVGLDDPLIAPTPGSDRPLWADSDTAAPCDGGSRRAVAAPPTQLFFGAGPATP